MSDLEPTVLIPNYRCDCQDFVSLLTTVLEICIRVIISVRPIIRPLPYVYDVGIAIIIPCLAIYRACVW